MIRSLMTPVLMTLSFAAGLFFLWPAYSHYADLQHTLAERTSTYQEGQRYRDQLESVKNELGAHSTQLVKLDEALPNEETLPLLYDEIQRIASTSGLILRDIAISGKGVNQREPSGLAVIPVHILVSGSYESMKDFLGRVQLSSRLIQIDSVEFSSSLAKDRLVDFSILLRAYSYNN